MGTRSYKGKSAWNSRTLLNTPSYGDDQVNLFEKNKDDRQLSFTRILNLHLNFTTWMYQHLTQTRGFCRKESYGLTVAEIYGQ